LFQRNFWPASTVHQDQLDGMGLCVDDRTPCLKYSHGVVSQVMVGSNADFVLTAGSTSSGKSAVAMAATPLDTTATRPLRIVDFVRRPGSAVGDAKTDVIVRLNTHRNRNATGVA
jgi:hypothetical protein